MKGIEAPSYLSKRMSEKRKQVLRVRFAIRIAALYLHESGSLFRLAAVMGCNPNLLSRYCNGKRELPMADCYVLERIAGRHILPREAIRPDLFDENGEPLT